MVKKLFFPVLLFVISISAFSCKNSVQPNENTDNHDFTFEVTRLGVPGGPNSFSDVWVYDENNIWAAGFLALKDTADSTNFQEYSLTHWDGKKWTGVGSRSNVIEGIWGFPDNKMLLADGGVLIFENDSLKRQVIDNKTITQKFWASSGSNVWGVGLMGGIVHYDGKTWKAIDFDRQWNFLSITGSKVTGVAYALAYNHLQTEIIKLVNSTAEVIYTIEAQATHNFSHTLTLANEDELFIDGKSIWKLNLNTQTAEDLFTSPSRAYFISSFAVNPSDIYFYGANQGSDVLVHYNGKSFKEFTLPVHSENPKAIKATSNFAVAVGFADHQAQMITIKKK